MSGEKQEAKGGAALWFLKKLFKTPATYLGLAAGFAVIRASLGVDMPMSGAVGGGIMIAFVVGMLSFLIMHGIQASHRKSMESGQRVEAGPNEESLMTSLRNAGLSEDADLLGKLIVDRDTIAKRCAGRKEDADATHTLELAAAIVREACLQAEELQDLVRRVDDPLLEIPEGAGGKIEEIRDLLRRSYRAVADSGSRLRRGDQLMETDFLADPRSLTNSNLEDLTRQLEEETAVSSGVQERLQPDYKGRIVMDDPVESRDETSWESD